MVAPVATYLAPHRKARLPSTSSRRWVTWASEWLVTCQEVTKSHDFPPNETIGAFIPGDRVGRPHDDTLVLSDGVVVVMAVGKSQLLDTTRAFGGGALRDLHVFTTEEHEPIYLRDDVEDNIADVSLEKYIDNERYGYVTRETYEDLHYTKYRYTVRGFAGFEQFRTFLGPDRQLGVLASFDQDSEHEGWLALQERLEAVVAEVGVEALQPEATV